MPSLTEGNLTFAFPAGWEISKPDDWSFYRNQFQSVCNGTKAVDLLAVEPGVGCVWCIEIKDYRRHRRRKTLGVAEETACKVRVTVQLAGRILGAGLPERRAVMERARKSSGCVRCCWQVALTVRIRSA